MKPIRKGCTLEKKRDPVPKLEDLKNDRVNIEPKKNKNHLHNNIDMLRQLKKPDHPPIVQDSSDGHKQNVEKAGLKLKYVFKPEYGRTPAYIKRKHQDLKVHLKKELENCRKKEADEMTRPISEEERHQVLEGLKNNLQEVQRRLTALPLIIDTISKQNEKEKLETRLVELLKDIEIFRNDNTIIVYS